MVLYQRGINFAFRACLCCQKRRKLVRLMKNVGLQGAPANFLPMFRDCPNNIVVRRARKQNDVKKMWVRVRNEWTCKYARGRFLSKGGASLLFAPLSILTGIDSSCRMGPAPPRRCSSSTVYPNRLVSGVLEYPSSSSFSERRPRVPARAPFLSRAS